MAKKEKAKNKDEIIHKDQYLMEIKKDVNYQMSLEENNIEWIQKTDMNRNIHIQ